MFFLLGQKVITILDAEVLRPGSQVGNPIGNPIAINSDGSVNEADRKVRFELIFTVILRKLFIKAVYTKDNCHTRAISLRDYYCFKAFFCDVFYIFRPDY